jgi:hypothetical protein
MLWGYLVDFSRVNDAYQPDKLKSKALVTKIETVFHFYTNSP